MGSTPPKNSGKGHLAVKFKEVIINELGTHEKPRVRTKVFGCIGCLPFSFGVVALLAYSISRFIP